MKHISKIMAVVLAAMTGTAAHASRTVEAADTLTASDAFVNIGAETLDILSRSMRLDMLDYFETDSIVNVVNTMDGFSHLIRPLTRDYIKVQVTPVTTLTIRVLPYKGTQIAAVAYTIGDSLQAGDTDLRFYDAEMKPLQREKFIKHLSTEDFFDFKDLDRDRKRELLAMVPFPTIIYTLSPDTESMKATLTVGDYLTKEANEAIAPYLRRERIMRWTGSKYEPVK